MNVYLFRDADGDSVIVVAVSLASAEALLDRAADNGDFSVGGFVNSTRVHIPVDGGGSAPDVNTYPLRQTVLDANTTSERILFLFFLFLFFRISRSVTVYMFLVIYYCSSTLLNLLLFFHSFLFSSFLLYMFIWWVHEVRC